MLFRSLAILSLTATLAVAQSPIAHVDSGAPLREARGVEIWSGYSNSSSKLGFLGLALDQHLALTAVRFTREIRMTGTRALEYTFDLIPLALISPPQQIYADMILVLPATKPGPSMWPTFGGRFPRGSSYGAGFSPIGLTTVFRRSKTFEPTLGATGGCLLFDRAVPTNISTAFNYTFTVEGGARILNHDGNGLLIAYRFHHISNAGRGFDNSAVASHVVSVGGHWRLGKR